VSSGEGEGSPYGRWYGIATSFVAPATLLSSLLFYFGYVTTRAEFLFFGVDVDTVGLATRDYVMRSPGALLVPLLVFSLGGATLVLFHLWVRDHEVPPAAVLAGFWLGVGLLGAGLVLLLGYGAFGDLRVYDLVTPALIGSGVGLALYAARWPQAPHFLSRPGAQGGSRPGAVFLALVVVATCLFWVSATVAESTGRGNAVRLAEEGFDVLPLLVLDTQERLYLRDGITRETALTPEEQQTPPTGEGEQTFRYRYHGLRLLVQGPDRMFLVPESWTAAGSTLLVPLDGSVRVRFRFIDLERPDASTAPEVAERSPPE
jgi:hypothetical protein